MSREQDDRNYYIFPVITENINSLNFQSKDTDKWTGLKNMTHSFIVYKKWTSLAKENTD
jgi:hypothetical protein